MSVTMRAYRERATVWLKPTPGRAVFDWAEVEFTSQRELEEAVAAAAAPRWPRGRIVADASALGERRPYGFAPGQLLVDGAKVALWGITSRAPAPTRLPPDPGAAGALLDEPAGPAPSSAPEWTPPPPPLHRQERRP